MLRHRRPGFSKESTRTNGFLAPHLNPSCTSLKRSLCYPPHSPSPVMVHATPLAQQQQKLTSRPTSPIRTTHTPPPQSSTALPSGNGTTAAPPSHIQFDPNKRAQTRKVKLAQLLEIRAIYRNYIRAKTLLSLPTPVYRPVEPAAAEGGAAPTSGGECGMEQCKAVCSR